ncbi:unnamed protein product [Malus baccata var. baccata]
MEFVSELYFSPKQKQLQIFLLLLLLFLLNPSATPLTFNFSSFPPLTANISLEGDAYTDGFLRLTKSAADDNKTRSAGRATYSQPFLLRQNATGKLADFTTNFTFVIDSQNETNYGNGFAFFIAPNASILNRKLAKHTLSMGLPVHPLGVAVNTSLYSYVAVEFDIHYNNQSDIQDPAGDHVGIDVNSVMSRIAKPWNGSIVNGRINTAFINYDSKSKNLSVAFTTYNANGVQVMSYLNYTVDLTRYLPDLVVVGFTGETGRYYAMHKINSWSFNSTSLLDDAHHKSTTKSSRNGRMAVGMGIGGSLIILVCGLQLVWSKILWKKREREEISSDCEYPSGLDLIMDDDFEMGIITSGPRKFSYSELAHATSDFSKEEKLGEGGFGGVYKGFIQDLNSFVAVKRISRASKQGLKEYAAEVRIIGRLRHRNLVQLIGWCHEKKLLLVYEFMSNRSLDSHLFKETSFLTWEVRYKIAQGVAAGLQYLHQEWEQCVLHRDIKSSNVMLDSNFNAKLGDFGLARLVDHGKEPQTTALAGTMGYMAPEYIISGKASKESDVYSFGIVALEIACGRKPIDHTRVNMVEWVWDLYGEDKVFEAADPKLGGVFDKKQVECLMIVGLWCAHPDYSMRPSMQQVMQMFTFEVPLPILPSKMPVATYFPLPRSLSMLFSDNNVTGSEEGGQTEASCHAFYNTTTSSSYIP